MDFFFTPGLMIGISMNDTAPAATIANPGMMGAPFPVTFIETDSLREPS
jgi:hypothetical protein